jgi:hypothetical protein
MATNRRSAGEAQHVASETSPLLSGGSVQEDQLSDSTLLDPDEQGNQVASRPKISVRRGVFIALAIWGLLFLQGKPFLSTSCGNFRLTRVSKLPTCLDSPPLNRKWLKILTHSTRQLGSLQHIWYATLLHKICAL